jgi:hypothetical protein
MPETARGVARGAPEAGCKEGGNTMNRDAANEIFSKLEQALKCAEVKLGCEPSDTFSMAMRLDDEPEVVIEELVHRLGETAAAL